MANTESPTSGTMEPDKFMMGLEPDDESRFDAALEAAFGPQDNTEVAEVDQEQEEEEEEPDPSKGSPNGASEGDEGQGGEGQEQTPGAISGDAADFSTLFQNRYGRQPEPGELEGYIALAEWAAGLTPQQQQAINKAYEDPYGVLGMQNTNPQGNTQPVETPATPDPLIEEFGEDHPLIQRIRQLEANQQQTSQLTQQQLAEAQRQETLKGIATGSTVFKNRYVLEDADLESLQGAVANSRIFPAFVASHNGDVAKAMEAALDYTYWSNPTYRQREIEKQQAAEAEKKRAEDTRKRKASSVSGTGGNGANRAAPPPKTPEDRWGMVATELREAMGNGQKE